MGIYLAGELIPAVSLPDFKATIPGGGTKFKVAVTSRAAFSAAQTRACVLGSTVTISANGVNYTGTRLDIRIVGNGELSSRLSGPESQADGTAERDRNNKIQKK